MPKRQFALIFVIAEYLISVTYNISHTANKYGCLKYDHDSFNIVQRPEIVFEVLPFSDINLMKIHLNSPDVFE